MLWGGIWKNIRFFIGKFSFFGCFEEEYEKYQIFYLKNFFFFSCKILIYLNRRVFVIRIYWHIVKARVRVCGLTSELGLYCLHMAQYFSQKDFILCSKAIKKSQELSPLTKYGGNLPSVCISLKCLHNDSIIPPFLVCIMVNLYTLPMYPIVPLSENERHGKQKV